MEETGESSLRFLNYKAFYISMTKTEKTGPETGVI